MDEKQLQKKLTELAKQIKESESLFTSEHDPELVKLAKAEIVELKKRQVIIQEQLNRIDKPTSSAQIKEVVVEIRAGTGGDEAAIFAADLFRMYSRFAEKEGWRTIIISQNKIANKGYKEIIFKISGAGVYDKLRQESGVHRVQRVPVTEKNNRIHTSTATVAIIPQSKSRAITINHKDLRVDTYRASGPGGQYVNKRDSAVRITHLPTGIVVASQQQRTQLANRQTAMDMLHSKLLARQTEEQMKKEGANRREQIGTGERNEKVRTYNFPQDRITDHRLQKNWHNIEVIMNGNLEPIIKAFQKKESGTKE